MADDKQPEHEYQKTAAEAAARSRQHEADKQAYQEICTSYHAIDGFRGMLLGLLPLASGAGLLVLVNTAQVEEGKTAIAAQDATPIGVFGFIVALGLFFYELSGIRRCNQLITDGQRLEGELGVKGQFRCYPEDVKGFIGPPLAAQVIYPAVLAAWFFVAAVIPIGSVVSGILALLVLVGFFLWSLPAGSGSTEAWPVP